VSLFPDRHIFCMESIWFQASRLLQSTNPLLRKTETCLIANVVAACPSKLP